MSFLLHAGASDLTGLILCSGMKKLLLMSLCGRTASFLLMQLNLNQIQKVKTRPIRKIKLVAYKLKKKKNT